jgi:uncharacterized protein YukE
MSQAYVDPERLRDFAQKLKSFTDLVENSTQALNGRMGHLGESWRDQEYENFKQQFERTKLLLRKFTEEANRTVPLLERDAQAAEEYQRLKGNF